MMFVLLNRNTKKNTCAAGTANLSSVHQSNHGLLWVQDAHSLVFCVVFCKSLFVFLSHLIFYVGHCIVCHAIYGFDLRFPCLHAFRNIKLNLFQNILEILYSKLTHSSCVIAYLCVYHQTNRTNIQSKCKSSTYVHMVHADTLS